MVHLLNPALLMDGQALWKELPEQADVEDHDTPCEGMVARSGGGRTADRRLHQKSHPKHTITKRKEQTHDKSTG